MGKTLKGNGGGGGCGGGGCDCVRFVCDFVRFCVILLNFVRFSGLVRVGAILLDFVLFCTMLCNLMRSGWIWFDFV